MCVCFLLEPPNGGFPLDSLQIQTKEVLYPQNRTRPCCNMALLTERAWNGRNAQGRTGLVLETCHIHNLRRSGEELGMKLDQSKAARDASCVGPPFKGAQKGPSFCEPPEIASACHGDPKLSWWAKTRGFATRIQEGRPDIGFRKLAFIWVGVNMTPPGDRRFWSLFPFTRVPVRVPIFDPRPYRHQFLKGKLTAFWQTVGTWGRAPHVKLLLVSWRTE